MADFRVYQAREVGIGTGYTRSEHRNGGYQT